MPDARCTRGRLCSKKHRRQQPRVHRNSRHSLHNGFNGVLRALPGDHAWLPPSPARRGSVFATLAPALERQDHTTSPSAQPPFVRAMTALGDVRPSHPLPNVRDDRDTPLLWAGTAQTVSLIWGKREAEYFCAKGWTGFRMRRFFARRANQFVDWNLPMHGDRCILIRNRAACAPIAYSNANTRFQSFFMSTNVHLFNAAASRAL